MSCLLGNPQKVPYIFVSLVILFLVDFGNLQSQDRDGIPGPTLIYPPRFGPHLTLPILMDWENFPGAIKYQLQLSREDSKFTYPEIDTIITNSEYLVDTLFGAHYCNYFWHVRAQLDTFEWTDWSETWKFLTFCLVNGPLLIEPIDGTVFQSETITLRWQGVIGSYQYDIWFDDNPEFSSPDYRLKITDPSMEISYLLPNKTYYWKTRSWHECVARFSDTWSFTTCSPLPAPELLNPPDGAIDLGIPAELTWNESPHSSDFQLQVALTSDFIDPIFDAAISGNSFLDIPLEEGNTYYWRVHLIADDPCGYVNWSQVRQFTTDIPFICGNVDDNGLINILDIVFIINFKYKSGPEPYPLESADANFDMEINILDIVYLINYLYKQGPDPVCP